MNTSQVNIKPCIYLIYTYIFTDEYCVIKIIHAYTQANKKITQALCHHNYAKNVKPLLNYIQVYKMTWQRYDISDGIVMS